MAQQIYRSTYRCTYFCQRCGSIRRRDMKLGLRCCETTMLVLKKAYAEAASKLTREERREWVRRGMRVFRRAGRRWTAAFSPAELARSRQQRQSAEDREP